MITANGFELNPTIFPDGTSQVWQLPERVFLEEDLQVDWRFEAEREFFDIASLRALMPHARLHLYMPFLPYGRQDKPVSNKNTFSLRVFAELINNLDPFTVTTIDAHNPQETHRLFQKMETVGPGHFQLRARDASGCATLVYPDESAFLKYDRFHKNSGISYIVFEKVREQLTGNIMRHQIQSFSLPSKAGHSFLLVDDICDGGATFISVAKALIEQSYPVLPKISLFVTHGIFSKGRDHLLKNGIDEIYTTDSLIKNRKEKGVFAV